jgi:hypothetical protein
MKWQDAVSELLHSAAGQPPGRCACGLCGSEIPVQAVVDLAEALEAGDSEDEHTRLELFRTAMKSMDTEWVESALVSSMVKALTPNDDDDDDDDDDEYLSYPSILSWELPVDPNGPPPSIAVACGRGAQRKLRSYRLVGGSEGGRRQRIDELADELDQARSEIALLRDQLRHERAALHSARADLRNALLANPPKE